MSSSVDLSDNRQPNLYASTTIPFSFAVICVCLRFWSRWTKKAGFWLDDWFILVALACAVGLTTVLLWWIPRALGRHIEAFGPDVEKHFAIGLFGAELSYTGVIIFSKFSIAALYWRIFKQASIKIPIIVISVLVLMWGIAVFLISLLKCIPTQGRWDNTIEAACNVDADKFFMSIAIPNIIIDVALLILPIPYVVKLHISRNRKFTIISIFLMGGFVCVASVMRLVAVVTIDAEVDPTWNLVDHATWAKIEADFAIISGTFGTVLSTIATSFFHHFLIATACLPTLRPVYLALRPKRFRPKIAHSSSYYSEGSKGLSRKRHLQSWGMSVLQSRDDDATSVTPISGSAEIELNGGPIKVTHAVTSKATPMLNDDYFKAEKLGGINVETKCFGHLESSGKPNTAHAGHY